VTLTRPPRYIDLISKTEYEVTPDYWWDVSCWTKNCPNKGPWRIFGPNNETFVCARCDHTMKVVRIP
jgi:hypothetical protein